MNAFQTHNGNSFRLEEIPFYGKYIFINSVAEGLSQGFRMIGLFPPDRTKPDKIISILADNISSSLYITGGEFPEGRLEFGSFSDKFPHTNYFECELAENFGYSILNHPWLRPVRNQDKLYGNKEYNFYKFDGEEVHEVAVGPIHAGVIEPGHFRFQCHGELVYHLEINLGYQHRGIEALMLEMKNAQRITLAESIAGDSVIGHAYAHCMAVENLAHVQISFRAQVIRSIAEELERIAMHISGLGGIANDIGLAIAASSYGRLRTLVINSLAELTGSRFGRGLFIYGGVRFDLNSKNVKQIISNLKTVKKDIAAINKLLFSSTGALGRFDNTGTVTKNFAAQSGLVGTAARSSGIEIDSRINFPYGAYKYYPVSLITLETGDVFARARLRALEIDESMKFIFDQIGNIPSGGINSETGNMDSESGVVSIVEGWRGEVVHAIFTDKAGNISQYKIKDPSFNNWYGLGLALRGSAISDFPLCNKSFDLSYSGHDL